jgi:hypothetical protein
MDGVEVGDIGRTDQDVQDDQGNGVGCQVGGGVGTQGAKTSPRCTRSGKVVKYRDQ